MFKPHNLDVIVNSTIQHLKDNTIKMETAEISQNKEDRSFKEKFLEIYAKCRFPITLEPLVFFYTISVGLNEVIFCHKILSQTFSLQVIRSNLIIDKICQSKLDYSPEVCMNLTSNSEAETRVLKHVTDYEALYSSISFAPK